MHAAYSGNPVSMSDIKKEPACGGMLVFMRLVVHASVASCMTCLYLMQSVLSEMPNLSVNCCHLLFSFNKMPPTITPPTAHRKFGH